MRSILRRARRLFGLEQGHKERTPDEQDAVNALALHLLLRFEPERVRALLGRSRGGRFPALEPDGSTFITDGWMRGLLRAVGTRRKGWKAAAQAIAWLQKAGYMTYTGRVKKPRRDEGSLAAAEKFQPTRTELRLEGGQHAQPTPAHLKPDGRRLPIGVYRGGNHATPRRRDANRVTDSASSLPAEPG